MFLEQNQVFKPCGIVQTTYSPMEKKKCLIYVQVE